MLGSIPNIDTLRRHFYVLLTMQKFAECSVMSSITNAANFNFRDNQISVIDLFSSAVKYAPLDASCGIGLAVIVHCTIRSTVIDGNKCLLVKSRLPTTVVP